MCKRLVLEDFRKKSFQKIVGLSWKYCKLRKYSWNLFVPCLRDGHCRFFLSLSPIPSWAHEKYNYVGIFLLNLPKCDLLLLFFCFKMLDQLEFQPLDYKAPVKAFAGRTPYLKHSFESLTNN